MNKNPSTKNTLLCYFLRQRLIAYETGSGENNKFSWKKYIACTLMTTDLSLKDISGYTAVSYGLLRKWRTEKSFKQQLNKQKDDFLQLFDRFLTEVVNSPYQKEDAILSSWIEFRNSHLLKPYVLALTRALLDDLDSREDYSMNHDIKISMFNLFLNRCKGNEYLLTFYRYPIVADLLYRGSARESDQLLAPFLQLCTDWCLRRIDAGFNGYPEKRALAFTISKMQEYLGTRG